MAHRSGALVGRDHELARLVDLLPPARDSDHTRPAIVVGPAGIGKSAVVRAVAERVGSAGGSVLVGRATPAAVHPMRPFAELAVALVAPRGPAGPRDHHDLHRGVLARLLDAAPSGAVGADSSGAVALHPFTVADAVIHVVADLPEPVLVIEDLHWADAETLEAVEFLCDHAPSDGLGVLLTVRSDEPSHALDAAERLAGRGAIEVVSLAPLSDRDVEAMVAHRLGEDPDPDIVAAVVERSGGRPLVVHELLDAIDGDGPTTATIESVVPATLIDSVRRRLDRLDDGAVGLVALVAELGIDAPLELVESLSTLGGDRLDAAIVAATELMLLSVDEGRIGFRHGLTRDSVLAAVATTTLHDVARQAWSSIGDIAALGSDEIDAVAALAGHLVDPAPKVAVRAEAARRALARGAPHVAVRWLEQVGDLRRDPALMLELAVLRVDALARAGHVAEADQVAADADRLARASGDVAAIEAVALARARSALVAERHDTALDVLADLDGPGSSPDITALRARAALGAGRPDAATAWAQQVVAEGSGASPATRCEALEVLGRVARMHDLGEAARWFEAAYTTAESAGLLAAMAGALHEVATIEQLDSGRAERHVEALAAANAAGAFGTALAVRFHLGALHGVQFDSEAGLADGRRLLDLARRLGTPRQAAMAWVIIGQAHASAGHEARARAAAAEARRLAPGDAEVAGLAAGACTGLALLVNEQRDDAFAEIDAGAELLLGLPTASPVSTWYVWPLLCATGLGDGERAIALTDRAELRIARGFDALWLLAGAVAAGRDGREEAARDLVDRSIGQFERCPGFTGYRHLGLRLAAESALDEGWADPGDWLVDASAWFDARGLNALARASRSLARRAGRHLPGPAAGGVPPGLVELGVTAREVDVLVLLAEGLTNREIGERLYISPRTVKTHVEHLLTKTGAPNRARLVAVAAPHLDGADDPRPRPD